MTASEARDVSAYDSVELFRGLQSKEVDSIVETARSRRFPAKYIVTHQGSPADNFLLLLRGRARHFFEMPDGRKLILSWVTPGKVIGGAALVSRPSTYLVSAETVRDCLALSWDGPAIRALARRFPRLLENALIIASDYISWQIAAHAALTSKTARERLASVLLGLAPSIGEKVAGGVELDVTNEELANSANITHYTASRMVTEWQRSGAIRKRRGKILLRSPEKFFLHVV